MLGETTSLPVLWSHADSSSWTSSRRIPWLNFPFPLGCWSIANAKSKLWIETSKNFEGARSGQYAGYGTSFIPSSSCSLYREVARLQIMQNFWLNLLNKHLYFQARTIYQSSNQLKVFFLMKIEIWWTCHQYFFRHIGSHLLFCVTLLLD